MASTKPGPAGWTYAQKSCCAAAMRAPWSTSRYQSNSARKLLIYIETLNCFFCGQFKKSLDLQGFARFADKLSTKLSTENLEICKVAPNQGLSALSGCISQELNTFSYSE
ncbi:hypothetical protein ACEN8I_17410 [Polaromonas sp. CT11-55]|uniref:hypothetical protein n=1 Tax=Polaromonas sp. CT11-55 TaxID=3243045 RepID=UPI0039A4701F